MKRLTPVRFVTSEVVCVADTSKGIIVTHYSRLLNRRAGTNAGIKALN